MTAARAMARPVAVADCQSLPVASHPGASSVRPVPAPERPQPLPGQMSQMLGHLLVIPAPGAPQVPFRMVSYEGFQCLILFWSEKFWWAQKDVPALQLFMCFRVSRRDMSYCYEKLLFIVLMPRGA